MTNEKQNEKYFVDVGVGQTSGCATKYSSLDKAVEKYLEQDKHFLGTFLARELPRKELKSDMTPKICVAKNGTVTLDYSKFEEKFKSRGPFFLIENMTDRRSVSYLENMKQLQEKYLQIGQNKNTYYAEQVELKIGVEETD